jgi:hypothetical protein
MKKSISIIALCFLTLGLQAQDANISSEAMPKVPYHNSKADANKPFYYGTVVEVQHGGSYTYMNIKEKTKETFWVVVNNSDVKVGDYVRFKQQLVAKNFESKELNRKFDEIMFADNLEYKTQQ